MQAPAGQDAAELVYQHVRGTLRTARTVTRYNGVRACLRLLSNQVGTAMPVCWRVLMTCQAVFPRPQVGTAASLVWMHLLTALLGAAVKVVHLEGSSSAVHMWKPQCLLPAWVLWLTCAYGNSGCCRLDRLQPGWLRAAATQTNV